MYKGEAIPDTRRPGVLHARIVPQALDTPLRTQVGQPLALRLQIENAGDTLWLASTPGRPGWTRLGIRLHSADAATTLIDGEWHRASLPCDVAPGDVVAVQVELPALDTPGDYHLVCDLVAEEVAWFADFNSPTARLQLRVDPVATSRTGSAGSA